MTSLRSREWAVLEWGRRTLDRVVRTPARVTAIYLLFGLLALLVSDILLVWFYEDPFLARLQILKGALEVLLTAGLIYFLTTVSRSSLERLSADRKRQREELSVLHRVLRHNLRNDINLVHGHARDLESALEDREVRERARIIREKTGDMLEYTTRAGRLRRINACEESVGTIDLTEAVESAIEETAVLDAESVELETDLPDCCPVIANHMLETAVSELLTNAVEHHRAGSPTIEVSGAREGRRPGCAELLVADDGPGMPEMVIDAISDTGPDQLVHLDGMGLWFVSLTVRESGGDIAIDADSAGTRVRLDIPRPSRTIVPRPRSLLPGH